MEIYGFRRRGMGSRGADPDYRIDRWLWCSQNGDISILNHNQPICTSSKDRVAPPRVVHRPVRYPSHATTSRASTGPSPSAQSTESEHSKSSQQIQQEWDIRVVGSRERREYNIQVSGIHVDLTNFEVSNSSNGRFVNHVIKPCPNVRI